MAAALKSRLARAGNDNYALLVLLGWGAAFLGGGELGRGPRSRSGLRTWPALLTGRRQLVIILVATSLVAVFLPLLSRFILVDRFFPDYLSANRVAAWKYHLAFDVMVAGTLAFAATMVGVMATFAFVFVPPWVAFRLAGGWRQGLTLAATLSGLAYVMGFVAALILDQPFGPTQVAEYRDGLRLALETRAPVWIGRYLIGENLDGATSRPRRASFAR